MQLSTAYASCCRALGVNVSFTMLKPTPAEFPNPLFVYAAAFRKEPWYKLLLLIPLAPLVILLLAILEAVWFTMKWSERREQHRWDALPLEEQQKWIELQARIEPGVRKRQGLGPSQENPATE